MYKVLILLIRLENRRSRVSQFDACPMRGEGGEAFFKKFVLQNSKANLSHVNHIDIEASLMLCGLEFGEVMTPRGHNEGGIIIWSLNFS